MDTTLSQAADAVNTDDKGMALATTLVPFFFPVVGTAVMWALTRSQSQYLQSLGSTVLRFHLTYFGLMLFSWLLVLVAFPLRWGIVELFGTGSLPFASAATLVAYVMGFAIFAVAAIAMFVFSILMIARAANLELYVPPLTVGAKKISQGV